MLRGKVRENKPWPKRDARRWIITAHDGVHVVTACIQTSNRRVAVIENARINVRLEPNRCSDISGIKAHRKERGLAERS